MSHQTFPPQKMMNYRLHGPEVIDIIVCLRQSTVEWRCYSSSLEDSRKATDPRSLTNSFINREKRIDEHSSPERGLHLYMSMERRERGGQAKT
jgi:hypothetical protein